MAFRERQDQIERVGSGEIIGDIGVVSTYTKFENGIKGGLFAKYNSDTDGIEPVNGSEAPIIAGVVKRDVTGAIEDAGANTSDNAVIVDVVESGLVTVETVPGATIGKFESVYVSNQGDDKDGKATNDVAAGNAQVDGYFYKRIDENVWAIRIK